MAASQEGITSMSERVSDIREGNVLCPLQNGECTQRKSNGCTSIGHSKKFGPTDWKSRMMAITLD
jgi:hypothetical protein